MALVAPSATAQTGTVAGRVIESETGRPVVGATIEVLSASRDGTDSLLLSDADGRFYVELVAGDHSFLASRLGYETQRIDDVAVRVGEDTELLISLRFRALIMQPVIISASRRDRSAVLAASASASVVGRERIRERIAVTAADHVRALPGMHMAETGIQQSSVVARGFNQVGSSSLLTIVDGRYANLPSLRLSTLSFLPNPDLDLERVEVLRGPASALYGPNAANGVLHLITASPIDRPGASASLATGERSVLQAQFRHAMAFSSRSGVKISAGYFQGEDWHYLDPVEAEARSTALGRGANEDTLRTGRRDFDARRLSADVRLDLRPSGDSEMVLNAGVTSAVSMTELTEVGAIQADDWTYEYAQARYRRGRFFAQAFMNRSDTGDSYLLRTGQPFVDRSWVLAGQIRHGFDLGELASFLYGVDAQRTEPKTDGTITGRNEDDDGIDEIGGYVHSEIALTDALDLVAAVRVDHHNRLEGANVSPRAALVFRPTDGQTFRLSYNGAFTTPTTKHLFLDAVTSRVELAPGIGYDVRARGVPAGGFTFLDRCEAGNPFYRLCMRTPFVPGEKVSTNGTPIWNDVVDLVAPEALRSALRLPGNPFNPDPALATQAYRLDEDVGEFVLATGNEIHPIRPTRTRTLEIGYSGGFSDRLTISADLYYNWISDYIGPLRVETPTVRYTPESVRTFLEHRLGSQLASEAISMAELDALVDDFSSLPLGIVVPDQVDTPEMILTYRNTADFEIWGVDLAAQLLVDDHLSIAGNFSHMSANCFVGSVREDDGICTGLLDIALNAPRNKGSVSLRWDDMRRGLTLEGRARISSGFSMNSGPYGGIVDGHTLFDVTASYQTSHLPGATFSISATNLFDRKTRYFLGAPEVGRLLLVRLGYEL